VQKLDAVAEDENEEDLDLYRASEMQSSVGSEMLLDEVSGAVVGSYKVHMRREQVKVQSNDFVSRSMSRVIMMSANSKFVMKPKA
jgi:hypothetical protein